MAAITIRNLDDSLKTKLRMRAAELMVQMDNDPHFKKPLEKAREHVTIDAEIVEQVEGAVAGTRPDTGGTPGEAGG